MPGNASFMSGSQAGRPDYGPGLRGMIWGLRGLILSSRDQISGPSRLDEGLRPLKGGDGWKDGRTDVWKFTPVFYRTSALWGCCPKREEEK